MKENEMLKQLKEQLQINLLQVFEDVNLMPDIDEKVVSQSRSCTFLTHMALHLQC